MRDYINVMDLVEGHLAALRYLVKSGEILARPLQGGVADAAIQNTHVTARSIAMGQSTSTKNLAFDDATPNLSIFNLGTGYPFGRFKQGALVPSRVGLQNCFSILRAVTTRLLAVWRLATLRAEHTQVFAPIIASSGDHRSSSEERILATFNSCWQLWKERMVKYFDADSGGDLRNSDYIARKGLLAGNYHSQGRDAAFTPFKIFNELHK